MRLDAPWGRLGIRVFASLARDVMVIGGALVRASMGQKVHGFVQRQEFIVGGRMEAGRRGEVILAASVAPNGFATRIAAKDGALMVHRLVSTPPREDRLWPV